MTVDAFGEKQTTTFAIGEDSTVNQIWSQEFPHSLGGFYSTMTEYLGFRAQSDEWKLMGASSYGDGKRFYKILRSLVNLTDGNGFELDLRYFNFYQFHRPNRYTKKMEQLIGLPPNKVDEPLNQDYYDLAAASQDIFEDIYIHLINQLHKQTKRNNLVLSGGSALNSVTNGKVLNLTQFENVFIPPSPDDSGTSLGAAYYVYHNIFGHRKSFVMSSNYWGPSYTNSEIKVELNKYKIQYRLSDSVELEAAELISQGKIIGWFQGALEFGDRALGNRSILADPRDSSMKDKVNETVKYREPFRPFAPSVLIEKADEYFENFVETPYMEKVFPIIVHKRSEIPAVTHIDGSGRLQTVRKKDNPKYYALIKNFFKITGVPVVLNTSFNLKGEAIVCSPADAIRTFYSSGLDALVIGDYLIVK
jgi:carbamoyltransferase